MTRMFAIIEREMRKFFRSPTLMIMSLMMPLLQLLIMGNAFGGKIVGARVGVVDYDRGRSEERRVGEEGRSRWSPYSLKKKNKARRKPRLLHCQHRQRACRALRGNLC